jgi:hypothetical protein
MKAKRGRVYWPPECIMCFFLCTRLEKKENVLVLVLCDLLRDHMVMNDSTIVDGTQRAEAADDVHG